MPDGPPEWHCPLPVDAAADSVSLAQGEGGRAMRALLRQRILPAFGADLSALGDSAILSIPADALAITTDSFVVSPFFFPGGDIGKLAVCGCVNDLVVAGARPLALTAAFILEEGLPLATLDRVVASLAHAARAAGVSVVAGDTKVVPRGQADGLFITATGVGRIVPPAPPGPAALRPGDQLLVSGRIGRHGIAVLAAREDLGFDPAPISDCDSLLPAAEQLWSAGLPVRAMRDATRGGVAAVLREWAESSRCTLSLDESKLPVGPEVRGACELLGLDPIHLANEGTMVLAVPSEAADATLRALRQAEVSRGAAWVGEVVPRRLAPVVIRRAGRELPLDEPTGAPLPRIC